MGTILDTITVFADNVTGGGGWDSLPAASGQSLQVRYFEAGTQVHLIDAWAGNNNSKMDLNVHSPNMADNTYGWRSSYMFNPTLSGADGNPQLLLAPAWRQPLVLNDTLVAQCLATATADVTFTMLLQYDIPGNPGGRFMTAPEVYARTKNLLGNRISPSAHATTSTYGTAEAITSDDNRFKAGVDYALLGILSDLPFTTLSIYGPDTANFQVSIPGSWDSKITAGYFYEMAERFGAPLIPVINSLNAPNTYAAVADAGGGTNPLITLQWAELTT